MGVFYHRILDKTLTAPLELVYVGTYTLFRIKVLV